MLRSPRPCSRATVPVPRRRCVSTSSTSTRTTATTGTATSTRRSSGSSSRYELQPVEQRCSALAERADGLAALTHPWIGALAAHEALVQLLQHDARLPRRERLEPRHDADVD